MKVHQLGLCLFALVLCTLIPQSQQAINLLPTAVMNVMASREMRYHHFVWHNVRNMWNQLSASAQATIRSYGWAPPRPAQDRNGRAITDNNSGEDFLYMHRMMIDKVNSLMRKYRYANTTGFTYLLEPNDAQFPMPRNYTGPNANLDGLAKYYKSPAWLEYAKRQEARFNDTRWLRSQTLGQLGSYIEFASDVHQGLHFRYSQTNSLMRVKTAQPIPFIDPRYDVVGSMWLVDLYCSQLNPWFWKIHGYVDNIINKWAAANGITNSRNIVWKGTWTGGNMATLPSNLNIGVGRVPDARFLKEGEMADMDMSNHESRHHFHLDHTKMNLTQMEHIVAILSQEGKLCDHYSELGGASSRSKRL